MPTEIHSRDELLNALTDASELEHGLLCQYLFAALTIKQTPSEGITWAQVEAARGWKRTLLEVSRQEMAHLGTVCNLLTAIGGAPHFQRPNFPQAAKYYPLDISYALERFDEKSLDRFIHYETPPDTPQMKALLLAPSPLTYTSVGDLYRSIRVAFEDMPEEQLFIGPRSDQDDNDWSRNLRLFKVIDRASAVKAVDFIIVQGEGSPAHRDDSHFARFKGVRDELLSELKADPKLDPSRPVAKNPMSRLHRSTLEKDVSIIKNEETLAVAELLNVSYETTLLMLQQFYAFGSETPEQREALRQATREMMSGVIRPVGEVLTLLPLDTKDGPTAGPCFELYGDIAVSPHTENAWTIIIERLRRHGQEGLSIANVGPRGRVRLAAENLITLGDNLERVAPSTKQMGIRSALRDGALKPRAPRDATARYARPQGGTDQ